MPTDHFCISYSPRQTQVSALKLELSDVRTELSEIKSELSDVKSDNATFNARFAEQDQINSDLRAISASQQNERLKLCIANIMIQLGRKVAADLHYDLEKGRLQTLARDVKEKELKECGVPTKYWKDFKKLPEIIERRNEVAHESEQTFAKLLLHPQFRNTRHYDHWQGIFSFSVSC